jgi:diguanylate cyclase
MAQVMRIGAADEEERAGNDEIARRAIGFAERYDTPLIPEVFSVWFAYAGRRNGQLNDLMDKWMNTSQPFTESALCEVYHQYLSPRTLSDDLREIGSDLSSAIGDVSETIETNLREHSAFSGALRSAKQSLVHGSSKREISSTIAHLHKVNQSHLASAQRMSVQLEKNRNKVSRLERELMEVKRAANTDYLTKLANRRRLDDLLDDALLVARHKKHAVTFALGDIDGLEQVNQRWGLSAGDNVMKVYANELQKKVSGSQVPARFSGAKFALLLPNTPVQDALDLVEQIRVNFRNIDWVSDDTGEKIGNLTVSFGLTDLRDGDTKERLIDRADKLLMEAKDSGRDKVAVS